MESRQVAVQSITAGQNDRKRFDEGALAGLAESIAEHGLAQPITVRPVGSRFEVICGERRFRAVQLLGWTEVPAMVRDMDDEAAAAVMLLENTARQDLTPIEEAEAYQARVDRYGWPLERIAEVAGVSLDLVRSRLRLLGLVPEARSLVAGGSLPVGHAQAMVQLDANRQRIALRNYSAAPGMTVVDFRRMTNELLAQQAADSLFDSELWAVQAMPAERLCRTKADEVAMIEDAGALPAAYGPDMNTAAVIVRYIADLQASGRNDEAAAVGALYRALLANNLVKLPNLGLPAGEDD